MRKSTFLACTAFIFTFFALIAIFGSHPARAQMPAANSQYLYISTATTTPVKAQAGFLLSVTINGGTAGVVTLYDIGSTGCTGTPGSGKFATIETIGATSPVTLTYNLRTLNGLCVVTAAATDLTVTFN
jgi:hypothetical protein